MTSTSGEEPKNSKKRSASDRGRPGTGKRRRAREMALQMLYQKELGGSSSGQIFNVFNLEDYKEMTESESSGGRRDGNRLEASFAYARQLVEGALDHGDEIDELIRRQAENWRLERMPAIDRNILRLALYELLYQQEVPRVVIVDEAIELAKKFGSEQSGRFVNGLLDGILKKSEKKSEGRPETGASS